MGKFIIPWYGGLPSAWTGCLIFFQGGLLGGYLYAHLLVRHLAPRSQAILHTLLLAACLVLMPIAPGAQWKPAPGTHSMGGIFQLLSATVGLPYLLLASTGPMTQAWFHRSFPSSAPYRLFALSNLGSMLGLLTYPFLFEPWLTRTAQGWTWAGGFAVFVVSCALCGFSSAAAASSASEVRAEPGEATALPSAAVRLLWVALPACASLLLLSVTNQLCQGMPSVPFLWILPLSLYLLSFIVCFEWPRAYSRPFFLVAMALSLALVCYLLQLDTSATALLQIAGFSVALFVCCMVCHGELALSKPDPSHLTSFYLAVAAGGALGGAFVGLAAPHLFTRLLRAALGLLAVSGARAALAGRSGGLAHAAARAGLGRELARARRGRARARLGTQGEPQPDPAVHDRFLARLLRRAPAVPGTGVGRGQIVRLLGHGGIVHGVQFMEPPEKRRAITSYFGPGTGFAQAIQLLQRDHPVRVGVIGLGIGTIAAWGRPEDYFRFYEINPSVIAVAEQSFVYLRDATAQVDLIEGDGRLRSRPSPTRTSTCSRSMHSMATRRRSI
jgi:hypothetical protein